MQLVHLIHMMSVFFMPFCAHSTAVRPLTKVMAWLGDGQWLGLG